MPIHKAAAATAETAESLAVQALAFLAEDPDRIGRFLAVSGIAPESLRAAAAEPGFLAGVLDHVSSNEQLLIAAAMHLEVDPSEFARARAALGGQTWEREVP